MAVPVVGWMVRSWMACVTAGLISDWLDVWMAEMIRGWMDNDWMIGKPAGLIAGYDWLDD